MSEGTLTLGEFEEGAMGAIGSLTVTTLHRQRKVAVDKAALKAAVGRATQALEDIEGAQGEVAFVLVSDQRIRQLNRDYAGIDEATDVLSFSASEGDEGFEGDDAELGDILVSVETAARQVGKKDRSGHPRTETLIEELALLFVHGMLHLLGYDHAESAEAKEMLFREQKIVARIWAPAAADGPVKPQG